MIWRAIGKYLVALKQKMHIRWSNFRSNICANDYFRANTKPNFAASIIASTRVTKSKILISSDLWESVLLFAFFAELLVRGGNGLGWKLRQLLAVASFLSAPLIIEQTPAPMKDLGADAQNWTINHGDAARRQSSAESQSMLDGVPSREFDQLVPSYYKLAEPSRQNN